MKLSTSNTDTNFMTLNNQSQYYLHICSFKRDLSKLKSLDLVFIKTERFVSYILL